jgi:hypothetical protein
VACLWLCTGMVRRKRTMVRRTPGMLTRMPALPSDVPHPAPFLEVRMHHLDRSPGVTGLCAGYERGVWRATQLADHVMEWLPEFALNWSELRALGHANAVALLRRAANAVYQTEKFHRRGEFGELLLHIAIRQVFGSVPAISKIYYKSAVNDTVKGFDAVHVVGPADRMELWLGEAKFYTDIDMAVRDVVAELGAHTATDYLRNEFALIMNKIDDNSPHAQSLRRLLSPNTSLDSVFATACVPVLLTYDSDCLAAHAGVDTAFRAAFMAEIETHYSSFRAAGLPANLRIHLFLLPLRTKALLVQALDERLRQWQTL